MEHKCKCCGKLFYNDAVYSRYCSDLCLQKDTGWKKGGHIINTSDIEVKCPTEISRISEAMTDREKREHKSGSIKSIPRNNEKLLLEEKHRYKRNKSINLFNKVNRFISEIDTASSVQYSEMHRDILDYELTEKEIRSKIKALINRNSIDLDSTSRYFVRHGRNKVGHTLETKILDRDGHACQICGSKSNLSVHVKGSENSNDIIEEDNLITICKSCRRGILTGDIEYAVSKCKENYLKVFYSDNLNKKVEGVDGYIYKLESVLLEVSKELVYMESL